MKEKVRNFVDLYNKNIDVNQSIFNEIERDFIVNSEYVKILSDYISFKKITEEICDLEDADVYEYEDSGMLEMQAYCYETYGTRYYWTHPNLDEEAYKKKKIGDITEVLNRHRRNAVKKMQEASSEIEEINKVMEFINTK